MIIMSLFLSLFFNIYNTTHLQGHHMGMPGGHFKHIDKAHYQEYRHQGRGSPL